MTVLALLSGDKCGCDRCPGRGAGAEELSRITHPLRFEALGNIHAGCVVGNALVACTLVAVAAAEDCAALAKFPAAMFVTTQVLYQH
eukprot:gene16068-1387_t